MGGEQVAEVPAKLADYDMIVGLDVRALLRTLGFDPGTRRLGELGPAQKSRTLNKRGRKLKITTTLLIQGSCGISRPFGDKQASGVSARWRTPQAAPSIGSECQVTLRALPVRMPPRRGSASLGFRRRAHRRAMGSPR